jgi:hypothetical protein
VKLRRMGADMALEPWLAPFLIGLYGALAEVLILILLVMWGIRTWRDASAENESPEQGKNASGCYPSTTHHSRGTCRNPRPTRALKLQPVRADTGL